MFKRFLVALDGSACSHDAFELALDLAVAHSSELAICSVAPGPDIEGAGQIVDEARRTASARGVACAGEALIGNSPAEAVIAYAHRIDADCIVAGTHGRTGFAKTIYGSVAREILENAECAVLAVRRARHKPTVRPTAL